MRLGIAATVLFIAATAVADPQYIYSRGSHPHIISAGRLDVARIRSLQRRYGNDFLWTRVDGHEYVIRDTATLDEVQKLYAPLDAINPDYEALQRRIRPLERREEELEEQMEASEDDDDAVLEREHRDVERRLRELEVEENRLDRRQDELEDEAERALGRVIERAIARGVAERL